jgi:hypothetical protein
MSAISTKFNTISGRKTFNDLSVNTYDDLDEMKDALKSVNKINSAWQYIDSTNTVVAGQTHVITIPKSKLLVGDYWLQVQLPANTYVSHTLSSALKEVKITIGDFECKYSGEDLDMLIAHLNKKTESDLIYSEGNNSVSAVSAATWFSIPLWFLGSKLLFSMNSSIDNPQNYPFPNHKLLNDFIWSFEFYPIAKFSTTGTNTSGTVRLRFKQYDIFDQKMLPNFSGANQNPINFIAPYFYNFRYTGLSLTDATEAQQVISQVKNDGEITEFILKIATNANYAATAPLLYTTEGIDKLQLKLGNDYIYEGLTPTDIRIQYMNEYCHKNQLLLTATSYNYYVMDMSESPMLLHNGSIGGVGVNFTNEDPILLITPTSNSLSATASTLYIMPIYKAMYSISSSGVIRRITKLT